jgi:hypothetical protein
MRTAEEILEAHWCLSNEESIRSSTGSPLSGHQVDDIIFAINDARKEALAEAGLIAYQHNGNASEIRDELLKMIKELA